MERQLTRPYGSCSTAQDSHRRSSFDAHGSQTPTAQTARRPGRRSAEGKGTWHEVPRAAECLLARVAKNSWENFTCRISCTNVFFLDVLVKEKVLSNTERVNSKTQQIQQLSVLSSPFQKKSLARGQRFHKSRPGLLPNPAHQLLPLSHTKNHRATSAKTLAPGQQVSIGGAASRARKPAATAARAPRQR